MKPGGSRPIHMPRIRDNRTDKPWSKAEITFLRRHYKSMTAKELAAKIKQSAQAVKQRAWRMGIRKPPPKAIRRCLNCHRIKLLVGRRVCQTCQGTSRRRRLDELWNPDGKTLGTRDQRKRAEEAEIVAMSLLRYEGFEEIRYHPRFFADYTAKKNGRSYMIDVTTYPAKNPNIRLRDFANAHRFWPMTLFVSISRRRYFLKQGTRPLTFRHIEKAKVFPVRLVKNDHNKRST